MSISTKTLGGFDLKGQFTPATVAAVMARDTEVRPQPPRAPTKVLGQFDARFGHPVAVHKLFPDDHTDGDEAKTASSSLGVAHDLIGCVLAGEDNTGACNHSHVDHIATARQCLDNYAKEEDARKQRREDVGQPMARVRFA